MVLAYIQALTKIVVILIIINIVKFERRIKTMPKYSLQTSDRLITLSEELRCIAYFRYLCMSHPVLPNSGFPADIAFHCRVLLSELEISRLNELCLLSGGDLFERISGSKTTEKSKNICQR